MKLASEPVIVIIGGIGTVVQLGMLLLIAFDVAITPTQQAAVSAFVGAILALIVRPLVTPMSSLPPGVAGEIADNKAARAAEKQ